jgi:outer membrane protein insertion porin family
VPIDFGFSMTYNKNHSMRKFLRTLALLSIAAFISSGSVWAADEPVADSSKIVKAVEVIGNKAISTETIMTKIKTRVGQPYFAQSSRDDIKRLYELGFFSDISVDLEDVEGGLKVIFKVEERPVIKEIVFEGNKTIARGVLLKKIRTKEGQYLNLAYLKEDIATIRQEYEKRAMPDVEIEHAIEEDPATEKVKVTVKITEGARIRIRQIYVDGNLRFKDQKILSLIKTRKKWLLNAGLYKEDVFVDDLERIKAFYLQNGYLDVKVDYRLDHDPEGYIYLRLSVEEGKPYSVGRIIFSGLQEFSSEDVRSSLKACLEGGTFSYDALREDVANIQSFYYGKGYIFVQVREVPSLDAVSGKVDVAYNIVENQVAYVERIDIRGNLKTKDKVIRREMRIKPGERFDGDKLKRSKERLYNLGYFEEVNYDTEPGSEANQENLVVEVKEAKTGSLSFGGGYSSIDQLVGFVEIEQRNFDWQNWKTFTGAGQILKVRGELGSVRRNAELSFTEPWLFDRPLAGGFDLYDRLHDDEQDVGYGYSEERIGGDLRLVKSFGEYLRVGTTYRLENVDISDVDWDATQDLKDEEGENLISSLELTATRDATDNVFSPSRGLILSSSFQLAGGPMGGDKDFTKLYGLASQYFPVFGKSVLQIQGRYGLAQPFNDLPEVPIYERFYAGGANTIRGYDERTVGPMDAVTEDPLGGEVMVIFNIEYTVPLVEFIKGAVFIDSGNVWRHSSDFGEGGLKTGIGFGVRVKTPIGPLKLDYGFPLDEVIDNEGKEGRFHFSMSHGF